MKKTIVVGGGLVGSLWAVFLAKRGYQVDVFEKRKDYRKGGADGGRSINLAMSDRGWKALEKAGIADKVRHVGIPMYGRMMHSVEGELTFQPYGKKDEAIYSVSRGGLNKELDTIADSHDHVTFHFNKKCEGLDLKNCQLTFSDYDTGERTKHQADLIFGTDGAFSAVRMSLQRRSRFNYAQQYLNHGYKELTIPPTAAGDFAMDKNALHIWPRGNFMLIALPNTDKSFTCTLFLPFEGENAFENLNTDEEVLAFFKKYFADTIPLIPNLLQEFQTNPTSSLVTIRCSPWTYNEKVLLLGDASHAIVPFYGQGMNSGFEDCTLLDEMVDEYEEDWVTILEQFNDTRIKDANAIADLALRNFIEMRDQVGDPIFLLRKKIEKLLHQRYPEQFLPVYSMVTFSHIPYSEALAAGKAQDRLFEKILVIEGIEDNWQTNPEVDKVFKEWANG